MTTISSRDFNQDIGRAKRAALHEPVFVTDRGRPTHVLMSYAAFQELTRQDETIIDLLAMPDAAGVDMEASRAGAGWDRPAGLDGVER